MPADFKQKFPTTRVIIDCTEVHSEMPSSLLFNLELFNSHKNYVTLSKEQWASPQVVQLPSLASFTLVVSQIEKLLFKVASCNRNLRMATLL